MEQLEQRIKVRRTDNMNSARSGPSGGNASSSGSSSSAGSINIMSGRMRENPGHACQPLEFQIRVSVKPVFDKPVQQIRDNRSSDQESEDPLRF